MEYIYPLIGGISAKLYDDIVDEGIEVNETFKEALKGVQWITLALASIADFNYSIIMYITNLAHHFGNPDSFKFPYEFSLLCVYPIFILLSFHTRKGATLMDCFIILCLLICSFIETMGIETMGVADNSYYKNMSRITVLSLSSYAVFFRIYFDTIASSLNLDYFTSYFNVPISSLNISTSLLKVIIYGMVYLATSLIIKLYLSNKKSEKVITEDKKVKEVQKID
jgi:hypothetical protein